METKYYLIVFDVLIAVLALTVLFLFFKRKSHLRVFLIFLILTAITVSIDIAAATLKHNELLVSKSIMNGVMLAMMVSIIVVYQADLKQIFQKIANPRYKEFFGDVYGSDEELEEATSEILNAVQSMAKKDIGALILLTPSSIEQHIMETGIQLNANISAQLLECIFNTKAPLHDGAVVIKGNKILASSCFLPLTANVTVTKEVGTRHRAAIGITEESDVLAIVVSEETGIISIAKNGVLTRYMTIERLKEEIENVYGINVNNHNKKRLG